MCSCNMLDIVGLSSGGALHSSAPYRPVGSDARLARRSFRIGQLIRDLVARAEVDLVGGLSAEGGVRDYGIVLSHIETDESAHGSEGIELVEIEPIVLQ